MKKTFLMSIIISLCAGQSFASYIFEDYFDTEHGGVGITNYTGFANWTVTDGTVDLIGNGYYDYMPGHGLYVDMDGSSGNAGILSRSINLTSGTYALSFDLAGNNIDNAPYNYDPFKYGSEYDSVVVTTGSVSITYTKKYDDPFESIIQLFTVNSNDLYNISFEGLGGDYVGLLLDNVKLSIVPLPATILLGLLGLGVGGLKLRKSMK